MGKHYVPQHYLRAFATPADDTQLWMYDKRTATGRVVAIKRAAQQRDYYTPEEEIRLTKEIENPGNAILDRLRRGGTLGAEDRPILARYLAVMMMRVPRKRRTSRALLPSVLDHVVGDARKAIEVLPESPDGRRAWMLGELARVHAKFEREPPAEVMANVLSPWPSDGVIESLTRMTWRIMEAPPGSFGFLTSDNPAHFFEAYGVGSAESELTFPIAPTRVLLGSHQGPPGQTIKRLAKPSLVKEVNRRIAAGAERFLFTHRAASWIATLASRPRPYLSRLVWTT
jgi:hypothetical protein